MKHIVLIDDNLAIREVVKIFASKIQMRINQDVKIYTSEDGIQGLGYIFIVRPEVVIIDLTLPKYSGKELIEYVSTNQQFNSTVKKVIALYDSNDQIPSLPSEYVLLDKRKTNFLTFLVNEITKGVLETNYVDSAHKVGGITKNLGTFALKISNLSEKTIKRVYSSNILTRFFLWPIWVLFQFLDSLSLLALKMTSKNIIDDNIDQSNKDISAFRARYYPSLVVVFVGIFILLLQLGFYITGSFLVLETKDEIVSVAGASWYNASWQYRKEITIDNTYVAGNSHTNFPIYFTTSSDSDLIANARSDGADILFTAGDGTTLLDFEEVSYSGGSSQYWIEIPTLLGITDTVFYMYYGNASQSTSLENDAGIWNTGNNYVARWDLNQDPSNSAPQFSEYVDSKTGTAENMDSSNRTAGQLNESIIFNGSNERITHGFALPKSTGTISHWLKPDQIRRMLAYSESDGTNSGRNGFGDGGTVLEVHTSIDNNNQWHFFYQDGSGSGATAQAYGGTATSGSWAYVVATWDRSGNMQVYVDGTGGTPVSMSSKTLSTITATETKFGATGDERTDRHWDGEMDEVRVSNVVRSQDWIETEYNNQAGNVNFYSTGVEEENADLEVTTSGSQASATGIPTTNFEVGGKFILTNLSGSRNVTSITISESGTIDASTDLDNIKLVYDLDTSSPYNCASETYSGGEAQFGSTDTNGFDAANGSSTFTGSVNLDTTTTMCVYTVVDIVSGAGDGETIEIQIDDASTDVIVSSGTVTPNAAVALSGTTTLDANFCADPFSNGYCYRREITIDHTKVEGTSDYFIFQVPIKGTYSYLATTANGGDVKNSNGYDIIFTANDDGTSQFNHEIEEYNASTGEIAFWVKVSPLDYNDDTVFYMFYSNGNISSFQGGTSVWSGNAYSTIHHFEETSTSSGAIEDSGVDNLDNIFAQIDGTGSDVDATGQVNGAFQFDGNNDYIAFPDNTYNSIYLSLEAWVKFDVLPGTRNEYAIIATKQHSTSPFSQFFLEVNQSNTIRFSWTNSSNTNVIATNNTSLSAGQWYYIVGHYDAGTLNIYVNGDDSNTTTASLGGFPLNSDGELRVGAAYGGGGRLDGIIDEFRIGEGSQFDEDLFISIYNSISDSSFYSIGGQQSANTPPSVGSVTLNSGNNISLTENTTTTVSWTASVTDVDGYTDITGVEGKVYRNGTGAGPSCSLNDNNCYEDTSCTLTSCSGNSCTATCSADIYFFAEPTDPGSTYASTSWASLITANDGSGTDTTISPALITDMNTLRAIEVDSTVTFGTLFPGSNSGSNNETVDVTNTGNSAVDIDISGTDLCNDSPTCAGTDISVGSVEYSLFGFSYGSGLSLSGTATKIDVNMAKPTTSPSNSTDILYFGIEVPTGLTPGSYVGTMDLIAVDDT